MEAMLGEMEYFTPAIVQNTVLAEYDEVVPTVNAINADGAGELAAFEFNIVGANDLYRDLNNSYIVLRLKVKHGAADLGADSRCFPVQNFLHSLFSNVSVSLCGKEISEKDSNYAYRAYLETLLTLAPDVLTTRCAASGWVGRDVVGEMDNIAGCYDADATKTKAVPLARKATIEASRVLTLVGRPHVDLFHQKLCIPPNCSVNVRFTPNKAAFTFMAVNAVDPRVVLLEAKMYVRTKRVNPDMILAHKEMLQRMNMRFPMSRVTVSRFGIAQGFKTVSIPLNFPGKLPRRLFVGFVTNAAATGAKDANPYNFQNFGATSINLNVNGTLIPANGMSMDFTAGDVQRAYWSTLAALELDNTNQPISLTPAEFKNGYTIYGFKIAPGPVDSNVFTPSSSVGSCTLNVTFDPVLGAATDMIVYAETPSVIEIDKMNAVTIV